MIGSLNKGLSEYLGIHWNAWLWIRPEGLLYTLDEFLMDIALKSKQLARKPFPQNLGWHGAAAVGIHFM